LKEANIKCLPLFYTLINYYCWLYLGVADVQAVPLRPLREVKSLRGGDISTPQKPLFCNFLGYLYENYNTY
jgi:hypothetical protein